MEAQTISARQIIHNHTDGRLSARPEYYSGRGVNRGDLNGNHLFMVHTGIKKELGDEAAAAFVQLVENAKDMSATGFLNALYRLEGNNWKFDKRLVREHDGVAFNNETEAMFTVFAAFGRRSSPEFDSYEGEAIKFEFYRQIGHTIKQKPRTNGYGNNSFGGYGYGNMDMLSRMPLEDAIDQGYLPKVKAVAIKLKRVSVRKKLPSKDSIPANQTTVYHVYVGDSTLIAGPFRSRRRAGRYIKSDSTLDELNTKIVSHPRGWSWSRRERTGYQFGQFGSASSYGPGGSRMDPTGRHSFTPRYR